MGELKIKTVSGIKWLVSSSFIQKGISVATTIVLARILTPSVFGLCALAFIISDAFSLFKSMGFDSALVQKKENIEKAANTAFFVILALGIILYIALFFSAPFIGKFLNNLEVVNVIRALGIGFVISCFGKIPAALLEKKISFKKIASVEFIGRVIFSIVAILFAILGFKVWSLVIAFIIKTVFENYSFWVLTKWTPNFTFDVKTFWEMFHFGKFLALAAFIWFLKMTLDNLLVGKFLGVTALGIYAIAFNIANFGADYFASRVYRVIFPVFSKMQYDKNDLRQGFLKTTKLTGLFAFPFFVVLVLFGDGIITIIYGSKWVSAIPTLKVLAFAGLLNTLPVAMLPLFNAINHPKAGFWYNAVQVGLFFIFISPAAKIYGLIGVAWVVTLSQLIAIMIYLPFTMKLISLRTKDFFMNLKTGVLASLIMLSLSFILKNVLSIGTKKISFYYDFIIPIVFGVGIYSFAIYKLEKNLFKELKELVFL